MCWKQRCTLPPHTLRLDTTHWKMTTRFVKSPSESIKQEVAGEGPALDGALGAPGCRANVESWTMGGGMDIQGWEGLRKGSRSYGDLERKP